jgi:SM-20-related protein
MMLATETSAPSSSTDGLMLDYAALDDIAVSQDPFTHLVVRNFLPPAALTRIHAELPRRERGGSFPPQALSLGAATQSLMRELEGPVLRRAIAEKFDLDLDDAPSMLTLRLATREKDGQIHADSCAKRVTALLYLNPASAAFEAQDGCLRLMRSDTNLDDYAVEVPPTDGTLLVFPNGPTSWHGHRPHVGQRYSVQLNYMTNDAKARTEMRRHRLSALLKRFT